MINFHQEHNHQLHLELKSQDLLEFIIIIETILHLEQMMIIAILLMNYYILILINVRNATNQMKLIILIISLIISQIFQFLRLIFYFQFFKYFFLVQEVQAFLQVSQVYKITLHYTIERRFLFFLLLPHNINIFHPYLLKLSVEVVLALLKVTLPEHHQMLFYLIFLQMFLFY